MAEIKLIALDLDGTLFRSDGTISQASIDAINYASSKGVYVVISTGRGFSGLPLERLEDTDMNYALTANGSAVFRIHPKHCLFATPMDDDIVFPVLEWLDDKDIRIQCFVMGKGMRPEQVASYAPNLDYSEEETRITHHMPVFLDYLKKNEYHVDKVTLDFKRMADGTLKDRAEVDRYCRSVKGLEVVSGGFNNIEFTREGVDKGVALLRFAELMGIKPEETMAIGDTGNDISIIMAAGVGVAMGNAEEGPKEIADDITDTNDRDGVAKAIMKYVGHTETGDRVEGTLL